MKITESHINNLNTRDRVANEIFGIEPLGISFNYNFRWFWSKAITFYNYRTTLINLPLSESKKVAQIHLN